MQTLQMTNTASTTFLCLAIVRSLVTRLSIPNRMARPALSAGLTRSEYSTAFQPATRVTKNIGGACFALEAAIALDPHLA